MNFNKAHWTAGETDIHISIPLTKINKSNRTVSGWATLDNEDEHGDVVTAEASRKAFAEFRGNIREQHSSLAVGKLVDMSEKTYADSQGNIYKGVYATAYISKGAQDTWEKVLDGTLSGFSIGGSVVEAENEFNKSTGKPVRFIKEYRLLELSLVDNPANQLANIVSIQKSVDGEVTMKGITADTLVENVFYCEKDDIAVAENAEAQDCGVCENKMAKIGWFEYTSPEEKTVALSKALNDYLQKNEGGVQMPEEITPEATEVEEVTAEETEATEVEETEEAPEAVEETAVDVAEVEDNDLVKALNETRELAVSLEKTIENLGGQHKETLETVSTVRQEVEELTKNVTEKFSNFEQRLENLGTKQEEITQKFADFEKDLVKVNSEVESVQNATALQKSADLGGSAEPRQIGGGVWKGAFLDVNNIGE